MLLLAALLSQHRPLLADGAFGTNLFAAGLPPGTPPETWVATRPGVVAALNRAFLAAGADIILTGTFGGSRDRLSAAGPGLHVAAINRTAARLAREAVAAASRPAVVAGSLGPPGDPRAMPEETIAALWSEQAAALSAGGIDVLWFETLSSRGEVQAAARVAAALSLPFVVTAAFPLAGRTPAGLDPCSVAGILADLSPQPLAIGANCGAGPADLLAALAGFVEARAGLPLVAKAGAGLPLLEDGRLVYPVAPAAMGDFARMAVDGGATIVGGCCGATPTHVAAMRGALDASPEPRGDCSHDVTASLLRAAARLFDLLSRRPCEKS